MHRVSFDIPNQTLVKQCEQSTHRTLLAIPTVALPVAHYFLLWSVPVIVAIQWYVGISDGETRGCGVAYTKVAEWKAAASLAVEVEVEVEVASEITGPAVDGSCDEAAVMASTSDANTSELLLLLVVVVVVAIDCKYYNDDDGNYKDVARVVESGRAMKK
jgi:hypothetical protein